MCGIAGIFAYGDHASMVDSNELLRIRERMIKRGPDGAGLWMSDDKRVGLAHRRLAIIDLSGAARQPMVSADGRFHIVFNGEIYNYRQLRSELQKKGAIFRTHSDTEVLLQLYQHYGSGMCTLLRGMYAFAIWDSLQQCLFLTRDPFGIKPLYIADDGQTLRFASQVKALLAGGAINKDIDPEGEYGYRIWGCVPEPHTLYKDIRAIAPGTWILLHRNGLREHHQFDSVDRMLNDSGSAPVTTQTACDPAMTLRAALLDTVRHHLIADVPVGIFLSAGIDSATLTALTTEAGSALRTITLGFEEYRGTAGDETLLARKVADHYGTQHQTVWITRRDFEEAFDQFIDDMDQPSIDGFNTWFVARAAAQCGLKVAISGLGGDEFFGGYPSFSQLPTIRKLAQPFVAVPGLGKWARMLGAPLLRHFTSEKYAGVLEYGGTWEGAYLLRRALHMPWELSPAGHHSTVSADDIYTRFDHPHAIVSFMESTRYMRNQLLRDADWAGMAHSIELRVPLVDTALVRTIAHLRRDGVIATKQDLACAAHPPLPAPLADRPKSGFTVPVHEWLLAGNPHYRQRGLRDWSQFVYTRYTQTST